MVVDHLNAKSLNKGIRVACIYLNHKEVEVQTPVKLLAGLWRQLVFKSGITSEVQDLYEQHSESCTTPSLPEIHDILHSAIADFLKVYIVVDALDEYPHDQWLILLEHLVAMGPTVNLMLTSRPHITHDDSFPHITTLEVRATDDDVQKYVDERIKRSSRLLKHLQTRPELHEEIHSKIRSTVDGM
jgi:Cdc6-like AAA superfamily ATPase